MIESRKFVAAAILTGLAMIVAGLMLAPYGGAHAASGQTDVVAERIGGAFAVISETQSDAPLAATVTQAQKGDRQASCAAATWPNIDASCLTTADGQPAPHVRTVTIGYQAGQNTTVLMRIPSVEVAQK